MEREGFEERKGERGRRGEGGGEGEVIERQKATMVAHIVTGSISLK